jgi:hypothetical protein
MANVCEISDHVADFLADRISLEQLEDWSAEYSWDIHKRADDETRDLAYQIRAILNAHSDDSSENGVRRGLGDAIRPFVSRVYAEAIEVIEGEPRFKATSANAKVLLRVAA